MKTKWPKRVPILKAKDFCHDELDGPRGTHCTFGWIRKVFDVQGRGCDTPREIKLAFPEEAFSNGIGPWNDAKSLYTLATIWNAAMRKLGYTVPAGTMEIP